jgi:Outer membrane protein beta-barrel domain
LGQGPAIPSLSICVFWGAEGKCGLKIAFAFPGGVKGCFLFRSTKAGLIFKKMKRAVLIFLVTLATGMVAQAQVALGVKGGISSSNVDVNNVKNTFTQFKDKENITGYHLGAFVRVKAGPLLIQPEGVFTSSGGKIALVQDQNGTEVESEEKFRFNRLDVPLLVGLQFLKVVRLQAGPVASVLVEGKMGDQSIKNYLDKSDFGWQAGLGFDIGKLTADVRYERVKREYTNQASSFDMGNQQVILSLGYKILGQ